MKKLNNIEISSFCAQLAMMVRSGISLLEAVSIMRDDSLQGSGKEILEKIYAGLEMGLPLSETMKDTEVFPDYVLNMTEIGERSGCLDEVLEGLSDHYENEEAITSSIKHSLTYPVVMLFMMMAVVVILIVKVLPVFNDVFKELGGGLTGVSASIMNMGTAMSRYSIVFAVILILLLALLFYIAFTESGRVRFHRFLQSFKPTRGISRKLSCARVAKCLSLCVRSGMELDEGLEIAGRLADNKEVRERVAACREAVSNGEAFEDAAEKSELFTGVYGRMINVGIRSGSADQVFSKIAVQYENDASQKLEGVINVIEPTMVAVLSVIVGMILLSVMLPLMNIMTNMGS